MGLRLEHRQLRTRREKLPFSGQNPFSSKCREDYIEAAGPRPIRSREVGNRSLLGALTAKGTVSNEGRPSKST